MTESDDVEQRLIRVPRSGVRGFRGDRLRDLRVRAGLSPDDLAAKLGVSRQAISTWEVGRSTPSPSTLGVLAEVLETSVSTLVPIAEANLRLADLRVHAALAQGEAAKVIGVSPTVLADIERGRKVESDDRVAAMARAYGLTPEMVRPVLDWENRKAREALGLELVA